MTSIYQTVILADGPWGFWPLGSNANDISGNGRNGTTNGGVTYSQGSLLNPSADMSGASALFNGSNGYISLPTTGLPSGNAAWSLEGWASPLSGSLDNNYHTITGFGTYGTQYQMADMPVHASGLIFSGFAFDSNSTRAPVGAGIPYHCVVTWDGVQTATIYLNGVPATTVTGHALAVVIGSASIGRNPSNSQDWFSGYIQNVAFYTYTLTPTQVLNHYLAGAKAPSQPLQIKQQVVMVFNSAGTFLDVWRDAPLLSGFKEAINSAPSPIQVSLPRPWDSFDEAGQGGPGTVGIGNLVQYYLFGPGLPATGKLRYAGIIDRYDPQIDRSGSECVVVTLTPRGCALGDESISAATPIGNAGGATTSSTAVATTGSHTIVVASAANIVIGEYIPIDSGANLEYVIVTGLSGTNLTATFAKTHTTTPYNVGGAVDPAAAMWTYFFTQTDGQTGSPYTAPLTQDGASILSSSITSYFDFNNQQIISAFQTIIQMLWNDSPFWFFRINMDTNTILLSKTPVTAQHTFLAGQHISEPSYSKDATGLSNVIVVTGATNAVQASRSGTDLATYGKRVLRVSESRAADNTQAGTLASGLLVNRDRIVNRYKVRVLDYRGDGNTGIGFDIESLRVGDSVQILNPTAFVQSGILAGAQKPTLWDTALWDQGIWDGGAGFAISGISQIVSLSYAWDYVDLEVGDFQPSQDRRLLALQNQFADWTTGI